MIELARDVVIGLLLAVANIIIFAISLIEKDQHV
jgi:hypothetical protein